VAYAELAELKGRAGKLAEAWTEDSTPGDADLELFLESVSDSLNAILQYAGLSVPVDDPVAARALAPIVADGALLLALSATWPGAVGQAAVADLKAEVQSRWDPAVKALTDGTSAIVMMLQQGTGRTASATTLWDEEPSSMLPGSESWGEEMLRGTVIGNGILPTFWKGQRL
jgi:hypothetical protein